MGRDPGKPRKAEQAPMQSLRVRRARAAAAGNTPLGAGGARVLHESSQCTAKNNGFPFRLLQYLPSEALKPTNTQPGQPRLANASGSSRRTALGNLWDRETSLLPPERRISQRKPLLREQGMEQGDVPSQQSGHLKSPAKVPPVPTPLLPTQLRALLRGGRLLVVGFVRHGAGDAAFASALAVGGLATFGGDGFFLIVVFPRCVVVLVPAKTGREEKTLLGWSGF